MRQFKFVKLFFKNHLNDFQLNIITDLFSGTINTKIEFLFHEKELVMIFEQFEEIDFRELISGINSDLYLSIMLFESKKFQTKEELMKYLSYITPKILPEGEEYLSEQVLLLSQANLPVLEEMRKLVFKEFIQDYEMLHIVKVFIENNMNTSLASKKLFMHRNTLINKIDKFISITSYDVKTFKDAFVIYHFLK